MQRQPQLRWDGIRVPTRGSQMRSLSHGRQLRSSPALLLRGRRLCSVLVDGKLQLTEGSVQRRDARLCAALFVGRRLRRRHVCAEVRSRHRTMCGMRVRCRLSRQVLPPSRRPVRRVPLGCRLSRRATDLRRKDPRLPRVPHQRRLHRRQVLRRLSLHHLTLTATGTRASGASARNRSHSSGCRGRVRLRAPSAADPVDRHSRGLAARPPKRHPL
jgi:hypothetical protein